MAEAVFTTARLRAERLGPGDANLLLTVYSDPEAMRFVGDGKPITPEACARWITITLENYTRRGYGMWALRRPDNGALVGCCGITHPSDQIAPETKYCLLCEHWGQGYATEALSGMVAHATSTLGLPNLLATVDPAHTTSHRVLEKAGFKRGRTVIEDDGLPTLFYYYGDTAVQDDRHPAP
jgi:ribosomal-protein-alanine N-acetyltransferase